MRAAVGHSWVDTGCAAPCEGDSQVAFSSDGRSIVFVRNSTDASGYSGPAAITTMDLGSGRVAELRSTGSDGSAAPGWSPDGKQIVFFRFGEKAGGGPVAPRLAAVWVVDADGQNLRQLSPTTLAAHIPNGRRMAHGSCSSHPTGSTGTSTRSVPTGPMCVG